MVEADHTRQNIANTIEELLEMDIIPIINENDTVAIDEIYGNNIGDNDMLSAIVARIVEADRLVILTDIDGLYSSNPSTAQIWKGEDDGDTGDKSVTNTDTGIQCGNLKGQVTDSIWKNVCTSLEMVWIVRKAPSLSP